jgi:acyl-CoA synthetase (AMP-forming)/AMP-acid ligase II
MFCFTFPDLILKNLHTDAKKIALIDGDQEVSYGQLANLVQQYAEHLYALGVRKGDRVCVHLRKSIDEIVALFAASKIGGIFLNINHQLTTRQLKYALENSQTCILITDMAKSFMLEEAGLPECLRHVVVHGETKPEDLRFVLWNKLPREAFPPVPLIDVDICAILYTSGSTGFPKGVTLTHLNVIQSAMAAATHLRNSSIDRLLCVLPLSFDFGISQLATAFIVGATLVIQPVQIPAEIIKNLKRYQITGLAMVPTMWIPLVRMMEDNGIALETLSYVANSGGMLPSQVLRAWPKVFPRARHYLMYGMTEGFRSSYLDPADFERKMGSIGKPLPNVELFVVHPEKGLCGPNERGELLHRGSLISRGYWNNPEATNEKIKPCPFLKHLIGDEKVLYSGDTVYRDAEGYLWFVSRESLFIKCSDFRISPTEVEDLVFESGLVRDVVAFGLSDEMLGQVVGIAVSTHNSNNLNREALIQFCRNGMPSYMWPRGVYHWEGAMPYTGNGKVDRPVVIEKAKKELSKAKE